MYVPPKANSKDQELTQSDTTTGVNRVYLNNPRTLAESANYRSSQALSPFYAEFITKIKFRKFEAIDKLLNEKPEFFYGAVDETNRTILHVACEKNVYGIVKLIIEKLFHIDQPTNNTTNVSMSTSSVGSKISK